MKTNNNISDMIKAFQNTAHENNDLNHRFLSFDYCYNYFYQNRTILLQDLEKSCLVLGFYLASWGMYRGSSFILQKNVKHLEKTIKSINKFNEKYPHIWDIDVDNYNDSKIEQILEIYDGIKKSITDDHKVKHLTLVTKILLGVFAFVPAFDTYFCKTFKDIFENEELKFSKFDQDSLKAIKQFYDFNKTEIDYHSNNIYTFDFNSGKPTNIKYKKAKIIDMYGFQKSKK
jgi:hypothetical protein